MEISISPKLNGFTVDTLQSDVACRKATRPWNSLTPDLKIAEKVESYCRAFLMRSIPSLCVLEVYFKNINSLSVPGIYDTELPLGLFDLCFFYYKVYALFFALYDPRLIIWGYLKRKFDDSF